MKTVRDFGEIAGENGTQGKMISKARIGWLVRRAARKIWFRAAVISAASVVVAAFAGVVAWEVPYYFTGEIGQDAVGTVLKIIASSMLAVTTIPLTAMVSVYLSATQLATPRTTQLLISDRTSQNALSIFLGALIFGIVGLQTRLYGGYGWVLLLIATVLLVALVVVTLLRWIAHLAAFGRMSDVIDRLEDAACSAMQTFAKDPFGGGRSAVPLPAGARPVPSDEIRYVTYIDFDRLAAQARHRDMAVHVTAIRGRVGRLEGKLRSPTSSNLSPSTII